MDCDLQDFSEMLHLFYSLFFYCEIHNVSKFIWALSIYFSLISLIFFNVILIPSCNKKKIMFNEVLFVKITNLRDK